MGGDGGVRTGDGLAKLASDWSSARAEEGAGLAAEPAAADQGVGLGVGRRGVVATIVK